MICNTSFILSMIQRIYLKLNNEYLSIINLLHFLIGSSVRIATCDKFWKPQTKMYVFSKTIRGFSMSESLKAISKQSSILQNDPLIKPQEDDIVRRAFRLHSETDR